MFAKPISTSSPVNGTNEIIATYTHTLDADNTINSTMEEIDNNNDGAIDVKNNTTYEYVIIADGLAYLLSTGLESSAECNIGSGGFFFLNILSTEYSYCNTGVYYDD